MAGCKLLIIDADISLSTVLCDYLESRGYEAHRADSGKTALETLEKGSWELVLMELQGLDRNGFDLLREIHKKQPQLAVVVLTTRTDRESQLRAFQLGCDDYVTKPFSMELLICRIEAIMRRVREREESKQRVFDLNGHIFDAVHQKLDVKHLSGKESGLLLLLCRNEGEVVDKHRILAGLWKEDNAFTARSLSVFINHLRGFLHPIGYAILAVRYKGYKLVKMNN